MPQVPMLYVICGFKLQQWRNMLAYFTVVNYECKLCIALAMNVSIIDLIVFHLKLLTKKKLECLFLQYFTAWSDICGKGSYLVDPLS
jgi:hypothetical protein